VATTLRKTRRTQVTPTSGLLEASSGFGSGIGPSLATAYVFPGLAIGDLHLDHRSQPPLQSAGRSELTGLRDTAGGPPFKDQREWAVTQPDLSRAALRS
jgi:hypothetical protein